MKLKRIGALVASLIAGLTFVIGGPAVAAHAINTQTCIPTVDWPQTDGSAWASIYCPDGGIGNIDMNVYEDGNLIYQFSSYQCIGTGGKLEFVNCSETRHWGTWHSGHEYCQMTWFFLSGGTDSERDCKYPNGTETYTSSGWH